MSLLFVTALAWIIILNRRAGANRLRILFIRRTQHNRYWGNSQDPQSTNLNLWGRWNPSNACTKRMKVLPWVVVGAGGLGAGKTSGAGTRGVSLNVAIGGGTGYSDTNGGESSNN